MRTSALTHDPIECPDCVKVSDGTNVAIRQCEAGKAESARKIAAARSANPEVDAIHAFLERVR